MQKSRQDIVTAFLDSYKQTHKLFWKALGQAMSQVDDVSPGLYAVLKCLKDPECESQHQIAQQLRQSDAAVSRKIAQLQEKGLVQVQPVSGNRRKMQVSLTQKGEELLGQVHDKVLKLLGELLQDVSDDMLEAMTKNNVEIETIVRKSLEGSKE